MSKVGEVLELIRGTHCMGESGLHDYHAARAVVNGCRKRSVPMRFNAVRHAMHPYRITVYMEPDGIRLERSDDHSRVVRLVR